MSVYNKHIIVGWHARVLRMCGAEGKHIQADRLGNPCTSSALSPHVRNCSFASYRTHSRTWPLICNNIKSRTRFEFRKKSSLDCLDELLRTLFTNTFTHFAPTHTHTYSFACWFHLFLIRTHNYHSFHSFSLAFYSYHFSYNRFHSFAVVFDHFLLNYVP